MVSKIRVLVVDDHTVMRKGLCALLRASKYGLQVVGEAGSGEEAVSLVRRLKPDVVLMDLLMPGMDGIEATRQICAIQVADAPPTRILMLTSFAQQPRLAEALKAGATGYLLKDTAPDDLVNAIHHVAAGILVAPRHLALPTLTGEEDRHLPETHDLPNPLIDARDLTEREEQVMRLVARGLTNQQIAAELAIGLNTVRTHVSSILRKLELENRTQIALYRRTGK